MLIAAMMVATVSANAQLEAGTFSLQPKVGSTVAWLTNMPNLSDGFTSIDKQPTVGALFGVEAEYQISDQFSIAAGVNYAMQGSGWEDYSLTVGTSKLSLNDAKVQLDYINVPLVANLYLFKGFAVKAGVQVGFLATAKMKGDMELKTDYGSQNIKLEDKSDNFKDGCEKVDFSIPVGISYEFPAPVVIDLRYNLGLLKVNKEFESAPSHNAKNNVIQLTVGYKLAL